MKHPTKLCCQTPSTPHSMRLIDQKRRWVTEVRRPESAHPLKPYTRTRTPLSAERPGLGCSLPGLASFTRQTPWQASLRRPPGDRRPQGTDGHSFGREGVGRPLAPQPQLSARHIGGLRYRGPLAPRLRPTAKKEMANENYKTLPFTTTSFFSMFA